MIKWIVRQSLNFTIDIFAVKAATLASEDFKSMY